MDQVWYRAKQNNVVDSKGNIVATVTKVSCTTAEARAMAAFAAQQMNHEARRKALQKEKT